MLIIKKYTPECTCDFYVKSHGSKIGEPIKEPVTNCFAVTVDRQFLLPGFTYYCVLNAYNNGLFKKYVRGSVVPFITVGDATKVITDAVRLNVRL